MVDVPQQERKREVLSQALKLPGADRISFIQAQFPADPAMWDELLAILDGFRRASDSNPGWTDGTTFGELMPGLAPAFAAQAPLANAILSVGAKFGPYQVARALRPGGMGEVAVADDARLPRQVVLKCLAGRWLTSPLARQRLMREARTAAALSHPNIATLYDVIEDAAPPILVLEYVEGRSLRDVLDDGPVALG